MQKDYKTLIIYVLTLLVVVLLIVMKKQQDHLSDLENGVLPEEEIEIVLDSLEKEEQIKNDYQLILRNKNISSKNILLLSERNIFINFDQLKNKPKLLDKMFLSIGQNIDELFIINIDIEKLMENHINKIDEILELYFIILNPSIFIDMSSENLGKFFEVNKLNLNFDYFKIPSVSNIIKNQSLKREAWVQLKLLKAKLDEC